MRQGETVTFGGYAGLDRLAARRGDSAYLAQAWADPASRVLPIWRGRPLIRGEARDHLALLAPQHPLFAQTPEAARIFLGEDIDGDGALFACDLSSWEPEGLDAAAQAAFFDPSEHHHPLVPIDHRFAELRGVMSRISAMEAELAAMARGLLEWHKSHGFCARCGAATEAVMSGWQRNCPSCKAPHFPRTDPVVIMLITDGNRVLLGRSPGWPEGMYSLLAGFIEPGEAVFAAVRREVLEEAGVKVGAVRYLASQPWPFPASLMIGCAGEAIDARIKVDPSELEDALWMSREDLVEVFGGRHPKVKPARKGAIAHFLLHAWLADSLD